VGGWARIHGARVLGAVFPSRNKWSEAETFQELQTVSHPTCQSNPIYAQAYIIIFFTEHA